MTKMKPFSFLANVITLSIIVLLTSGSVYTNNTSTSASKNNESHENHIFHKIDEYLETPQWEQKDYYDITLKHNKLRYPDDKRRYATTAQNQEMVILSLEGRELFPSCKENLELQKKARRIFNVKDYAIQQSSKVKFKHVFSEKLGLRHQVIGKTEDVFATILYFPSGWPLWVFVVYLGLIFFVPLVGSFLVLGGEKVYGIYNYFLWSLLKRVLRFIVIRNELSQQRWSRFLAPSYFLEPRSTWRMPYLLRHDYMEDTPAELAYKPPINKIDYTLYILNEDDYDTVDLEIDELEMIDELLQFREENPAAVARLLKHRLGIEKFYNYFDEDILSDEDAIDLPPPPTDEELRKKIEEEQAKQQQQQGQEGGQNKALTPAQALAEAQKKEKERQKENDEDVLLYNEVMAMDEPWMHSDFDETYDGTPFELEEIRKRREIINEIKDELTYIHNILQASKVYSANLSQMTPEKKEKLQNKAQKLMEKYIKYSKVTKERVAELEPSNQAKHDVALSKYLPLINKMSHYNHRLNLKHEKYKDPDKRQMQLDVFGGP